jgi:hypothetical protein
LEPTEENDRLERLFVRFLAGNQQVYDHYCYRANVEIHDSTLTRWERLAIWIYTTTHGVWFREINDALRGGYPSDDILQIAEILASAFGKLNRYIGIVFRGIRVVDFRHYLSGYPIGAEVEWAAFCSASLDPGSALGGNVSFIIQSQNARIVGLYADNLDEREVVFLPNTRFRVDGVEQTVNKAIIDLTELTPPGPEREGDKR